MQEGGPDVLSVRGVATEVGTTTRAVYSVFGSKDGLIAALGARAFELLQEGLEALTPTDDPGADLVAAGLMFRRFMRDHPALFSIGVQRNVPAETSWLPVCRAADEASAVLRQRVARLGDGGLLDGRTVNDATLQFHALCEGLAAIELRGMVSGSRAERVWEEGLRALIAGFAPS